MATKRRKGSKKNKGSKARTIYKSKEMNYSFPMDLKSMKKKRKTMTMKET